MVRLTTRIKGAAFITTSTTAAGTTFLLRHEVIGVTLATTIAELQTSLSLLVIKPAFCEGSAWPNILLQGAHICEKTMTNSSVINNFNKDENMN